MQGNAAVMLVTSPGLPCPSCGAQLPSLMCLLKRAGRSHVRVWGLQGRGWVLLDLGSGEGMESVPRREGSEHPKASDDSRCNQLWLQETAGHMGQQTGRFNQGRSPEHEAGVL